MPILNYTTQIEAEKTLVEIQKILMRAKAKQILLEYDESQNIKSVSFMLESNDEKLYYKLPCNSEGVYRSLQRNAQPRYQTRAQAYRVAWRVIKDWLEEKVKSLTSSPPTS
jgi:hypothetical protein